MNMEIAVQNFILAHESMNASKHTIRNYQRSLKRFVAWLQTEHDVLDTDSLTITLLRGWVSYLQKTPSKVGGKLSDSTIHFYSISVLAFCHWLEREEVILKPITTRFELPRVEKKFIPTFTPEDIGKLLTACEEGDKRKPQLRKALTARNRAIVSVLIDTGIRLSELAGLRLSDVDRDYHLLIVHRKGNKWQQVPISHDGFRPLHDYLTKHRPYLAKLGGRTLARKEDPVFLNYMGEGLSVDGVSNLFKRLRKRTGDRW